MARFIIRNYGLSRQFPHKGKQVCLSNDQAIETDDIELAATLKSCERVHVHDRGKEFAAPVPPPEKSDEDKKERKVTVKVTVDDAEAVHAEKHPDKDEQQQETGGTQPPDAKADKDEIAYAEMSIKELLVLAKDRQIKPWHLKKDELIKALEDYDKEG